MTAPLDKSQNPMDDAIAWSVRLAAPDVSEEQFTAFAAWLDADAANREAYERVQGFESDLDATLEDYVPAAESDPANHTHVLKFPARFGSVSRRGWLAGGAALLAACAVLFVVLQTNTGEAETVYATNVGEQKTVALNDGTTIELNTATTIIVAPDGITRHVILKQGEALFHVAKDSAHPFLVSVANRRVRVVGTIFNVKNSAKDVTVVVAEGKVAVGPKNAALQSPAEKHLLPGDKLVYARDTGTTTIEHVDPARALSWHRGYLIYKDAPLSKVIADLNRYFPHRVSLDGAAAKAQRFSGVLKIDSEDAMLRRLQQFLPLTVKTEQDGHIILRAAGKRD